MASPFRFLAAVLVVSLAFGACGSLPEHAGGDRLYWRAPPLLPGVTPELRQPGYWVARLAAPDDLVMTPEQIRAFNADLTTRKLVTLLPLPEEPVPAPAAVRLARDFGALAQRRLFLPDGSPVGPAWWKAMRPRLNLDAAAGPDRYALTAAWADQRLLPDRTRLTAEVLDAEFDELQNSGYDIGTPFQVRHRSADGLWGWTRGTQSDGWIEVRTLAFCDRQTLADWQARPAVVVTAARAGVWADPGRRVWRAALRMGTRLPVEADEGDLWRVSLPTADTEGNLAVVSGWIAKAEAVAGALPYTRRAVVDQAFKLLDRPYGWGDSFGEQDCSRFVAEVFATFGLTLPRNSAAQGLSGVDAGSFQRRDPAAAKAAAVAAADPAVTVLRLDGHILLYLGSVDGVPYAIHSVWAFTQLDGGRESVRVINAATVSTLALSEGSRRGSLLERIRNVREYRAPFLTGPDSGTSVP